MAKGTIKVAGHVTPEQVAAEMGLTAPAPAAPPATPPVKDGVSNFERTRDLTIEIPDGRKIKLGPPPVPSMSIVPMLMLSDDITNRVAASLMLSQLRAMLYVQEIDGRPVAMPADPAAVRRLMAELGEDGFTHVTEAVSEYFSASGDTLKVIKKNSF